jgi:hypothetical protein
MNGLKDRILEDELSPLQKRRRDLLPIWIQIFVWIFMVLGTLAPICFFLGFMGINLNLALYGLETTNPLSILGITLMGLFAFKGMVAFGLWTEKPWAVSGAIIDGILGIVICVLVMIVLPFISNGTSINLRLELVPLIPYVLKMRGILSEWDQRNF